MSQNFEQLNLHPSLLEALKKQSIEVPTEIQEKVIPFIKAKRDVIAQSQTGTGKTLAYLLPLFEQIDTTKREMQVIVLVPTHELAIQIKKQIDLLSSNSDIKATSATIIGKVNIDRQIEKLKEKPHFIVGTSGRILELINKRKISSHTIKTIVIDEADRMIDDHNLVSVKDIIKTTLKDRQLMMFSATITQRNIAEAKDFMTDPEVVKGSANVSIPTGIEHIYIETEQRERFEVLRKLIRLFEPSKAIAFVNKNDEIDVVTAKLQYHGIKAESIQGSNKKMDRKKVMEDFATGRIQVLVCSDIAARGLDIEDVTHVFNFSMPETSMNYLHRVGRTGRANKVGKAVSIITRREFPLIQMYERELSINVAAKDMYKGTIVEAGSVPRSHANSEPRAVTKVIAVDKTDEANENKVRVWHSDDVKKNLKYPPKPTNDRGDKRDGDRGGYKGNTTNRDGNRSGGFRSSPDSRDGSRSGFRSSPDNKDGDRGGYKGGFAKKDGDRGDYKGGFAKKDGDRGGFRSSPDNKDGDRGGYKGGFAKKDGDRGDYKGGFAKKDGDRGGFRSSPDNKDGNRGGYKGGFAKKDGDRGDYKGGFAKKDGDRGGFRSSPDNKDGDRGGYKGGFAKKDGDRGGFRSSSDSRDGNRSGGYKGTASNRDANRSGGFKSGSAGKSSSYGAKGGSGSSSRGSSGSFTRSKNSSGSASRSTYAPKKG